MVNEDPDNGFLKVKCIFNIFLSVDCSDVTYSLIFLKIFCKISIKLHA